MTRGMRSRSGHSPRRPSSAPGGAAPDIGALVASRALQGAFAAVLAPAALSLIATSFSDRRPGTPVALPQQTDHRRHPHTSTTATTRRLLPATEPCHETHDTMPGQRKSAIKYGKTTATHPRRECRSTGQDQRQSGLLPMCGLSCPAAGPQRSWTWCRGGDLAGTRPAVGPDPVSSAASRRCQETLSQTVEYAISAPSPHCSLVNRCRYGVAPVPPRDRLEGIACGPTATQWRSALVFRRPARQRSGR